MSHHALMSYSETYSLNLILLITSESILYRLSLILPNHAKVLSYNFLVQSVRANPQSDLLKIFFYRAHIFICVICETLLHCHKLAALKEINLFSNYFTSLHILYKLSLDNKMNKAIIKESLCLKGKHLRKTHRKPLKGR